MFEPSNKPTVTPTAPGATTVVVSQYNQAATLPIPYAYTDLIPAPFTMSVGWYVEDNLGNSWVFSIPGFQIVDNLPPVFDLSNHPAMLSFNSILQVPEALTPPVSDNCPSPPPTVTYEQSSPLPAICASGTFTRTWTAKDNSDNTTVFVQTIKIFKDTLPPTVSSFPQNGSAPCSQIPTAYPAWVAAQMANFVASDPSGIKEYRNNATFPFPPGCTAPVTVKFTVEDQCGVLFPTTAVFSSFDNQPPIAVSSPRDTVGYCSANNDYLIELGKWISKRAYLQAFDSCSTPNYFSYRMQIGGVSRDSAEVVAALQASFSGNCSTQIIGNKTYNKVRGMILVEFLAKDACGNEGSMGEAMFGVIDTVPPILSGTGLTEECGGGNDQTFLQTWINAHGNATVTDECSKTSWTNFSWITSTGQTGSGTFGNGPYPVVQANNCSWWVDVSFFASDDCGNTGVKKLRFQIKDTTKPVFPTQPTVTVYCPATEPASPSPAVPAADNCDANLTYAFSKQTVPGTCSGNYSVLVTFTATDDCGNSTTSVQTYEIRDTLPPVFTKVPLAKTFRCDTFMMPEPPLLGEGIVEVDDPFGCSAILPNPNGLTTLLMSSKNPDPALCSHYTYDITRIFTARDDCGNTATATQILNIVDNLAPELSGFDDTTTLCERPLLFPAPIAQDACGSPTTAPVKLSDVLSPGPCADTYMRTWTWQSQDVCGNKGVFEQVIMVRDTTRPVILTGLPADVSVECDAVPVVPLLSTFTSSDNCDAVPTIAFSESELRDPNTANCDHWANYIIRRQWTVTDNCGNARTYTQNIQVQDNTGPVITPLPALMLPADQGVCGANAVVPAPLSLFDLCTALASSVTLRDTVPLVNTSGLPNTQIPVDTVVFQWPSPNLPPAMPVLGSATLTITMDKADTNNPTEFLKVVGEDGVTIGQTAKSVNDCNSQSSVTIPIPANNLNAWLTDGQLVIKLVPQGITPAINEVNASCMNGRALAELTYQFSTQQTPIALKYQLDGGAPAPFPPSGSSFLSAGAHTVVYTATDCAGNSSTASTTLQVLDLQPPNVTAPPKQTYYVGANNCQSTVTLPFPTITDNCDVSGMLMKSSAVANLDFKPIVDLNLIPKDLTLSVTGLIPNAVGVGKLKILFKGTNTQPGQFFRIFSENNAGLGSTKVDTALTDCNDFVETTISISADTLNKWAVNGVATFKLVADDNGPQAIAPCGPQTPGPDAQSMVQAVLMYSYGMVNYEIQNAAGTPVQSGLLNGNQTTATLSPGNYKVRYSVADNSGVVGMTMFNMVVRDTVRPTAKCKDAIINTFPTGKKDTIQIATINDNSTDNCSGVNLNYALSKSVFSCLDIPQNPVAITLTVTDTSGNSATCNALIQIKTAAPMPTAEPPCDGGTLKLFANPPAGGPYTYNWAGPKGYMTDSVDPLIPNATKAMNDGTYTVTITGVPGCSATGNVTVSLISLPVKPILSLDSLDESYCAGNNVVLSIPNTGATYEWYELVAGNPVLMGTTQQPNATIFTVTQPSLGQHQYFVRAIGSGCISQNSDSKTITMSAVPTAQVEAPLVVRCEGESLSLGAVTVPGGALYHWSGPSSFFSNQQFPLVTGSLDSMKHAGIYTHTVFKNGCRSAPSLMEVKVKKKPARPTLSTAKSQVCEGVTVLLISSLEQAAEYRWKSPTQTHDTITQPNVLGLLNITKAFEGDWRVSAFKDGCESIVSDPLKIEVQEYPKVAAPPQASVCDNSPLTLSATSDKPIATWTWTGPGGYKDFGASVTRTPGMTGIYKVVGATLFGCSDSAFVNAQVAPPLPLAVSNDGAKCLTGTQTIHLFPATPTFGGPFTFMWTGPNYVSTDSVASIPNATALNTGPYTLVIKDKFSCSSIPATTSVAGQNIPEPPLIQAQPASACPGEMVVIKVLNSNAYNGTTVKYRWTLPGALTDVTTSPEYKINSLNSQFAGAYKVEVEVDSCTSMPSGVADVEMKPIPATPVILSNQPVCSGQTLSLSVKNPIVGASYFWKNKNLTSSPSSNWDIPNADSTLHSGKYICQVSVNGCLSPENEGEEVVVHQTPQTPFAFTLTSPLCLGQTSTLKLEIDPPSATNGASYQWFNAAFGSALAAASPSPVFQTLNLASVLQPGMNKFYVVATRNNCASGKSQEVVVLADTIPSSQAFAGLDFFACGGEPFTLRAAKPSVGNGSWSLVSGSLVTIASPNSDTTLVSNAFPGTSYLFRWTLSAGACKNYSSDDVTVSVNQKQTASSVPIVTVCNSTTAQLSATQGSPFTGFWSQPIAQAMGLNVKIADSSLTNTMVSSLEPGFVYFFNWNIQVPGCPPVESRTVVRSLKPKPFLGPDVNWCSPEGCYLLSAPPLGGGNEYPETGRWYSPETNLKFDSPNNVSCKVCGLKPGKNMIIWETNGGVFCGNDSRDTFFIDFGLAPVLTPDATTVPYGTPVIINVLNNDLLPDTREVFISKNPLSGRIDTLSEGIYRYQPLGSFVGPDIAYYTVCNFACPGDSVCRVSSITFTVLADTGCDIPTVITPNNDGLNDAFTVKCQQGESPSLTLTVFNQWGDEVLYRKPYLNDWEGDYNGEPLPVGTYYVILDFGDGTKPYAGFLMIQR